MLFNYIDGGLLSKDDIDFQGTSLRNTLVGVFVVTSVLFWSRCSALTKGPLFSLPMVNLVITLACLFFVLASVSRSNILVFVFAASIIVLTQISASGREFRYSRGQIWGSWCWVPWLHW